MGRAVRSQFFRYALTYILVLIIPVMAFFAYFGLDVARTLRTKLDEQLQADVQETGAALSNEFQKLVEIAVLIDRSNEFLPFRLTSDMDLVVAHQYLRRINSVNGFVVDIAYVPSNAERVYTVIGPMYPSTFFRGLAGHDPVAATKLEAVVAGIEPLAVFTVGPPGANGRVFFGIGIPIYSPAKRGTMVFEINRNQLDQLLDAVLPAGGRSAISLVTYPDDNTGEIRELYRVSRGIETPGGEDLTLFSFSIDDARLQLRLVVDRRTAYGEVVRAWFAMIALSAFVLVVSIPLIYLFAISRRSPLHRLFSFLQTTFDHEEIEGNVIDFTESRIERLVVERDTFSAEAGRAESFVRRELLVHIVNGSVENWENVREQCDHYGIDLSFRTGRVIVLTPAVRCHEHEVDRVVETLEDVIEQRGEVYGYMDLRDGDFVLIVTDVDATARSAMTLFLTELKNRYGFVWNVSVSAPFSHYLDLPRAYIEVKSAQEHRFVLGFDKVLLAEEVLQRDFGRPTYPANGIDRLYSYAHRRDLARIHREISRMFVEMKSENLSLFFARSVSYHVITALVFAVSERSESNLDIWEYAGAINLSSIRTFPEIEDLLLKVSSDLLALAEETGTTVDPSVGSFGYVVKYVASRSFESSLVAKAVADTFGMSLSNFSHRFKRSTGKTFRTYVEDIRIGEAKRLLRDTDATVTHIVDSVGFHHANSFIKSFKRKVGCTPIEYRNRHTTTPHRQLGQ